MCEEKGAKYGRWVVIGPGENRVYADGSVTKHLLCRCECGVVREVAFKSLRKGNSLSCGCLARERCREKITKHGKSKNKIFFLWHELKRRCYDKKRQNYRWYGAKGITVCKEWFDSFPAFEEHAMSCGYKEGLTIDRLDTKKGYEPGNIRFITQSENSRKARREDSRSLERRRSICL